MESNEIFQYSNNFLDEIKEDLIKLRMIKNYLNPQKMDYRK